MSSHGLVLVPQPALATRSSRAGYVPGALASPVSVAAAVFAGCVGLGVSGVAAAVLAVVAVLGLAGVSVRSALVRRHLARQAVARARSRREAARLRRLRPSGPARQQQYVELRDLVDQIDRMDPGEAARFELQDLLEHFIVLAITHQRCLEALRLAGSHDLPQTTSLASATRYSRRREIMARRHRHRDECLRRIERIVDEIEAIDELVRLVAQRVACPPDPELGRETGREIERRLWEADEVDAALRQLSA